MPRRCPISHGDRVEALRPERIALGLGTHPAVIGPRAMVILATLQVRTPITFQWPAEMAAALARSGAATTLCPLPSISSDAGLL